jgi:hypothetical protein
MDIIDRFLARSSPWHPKRFEEETPAVGHLALYWSPLVLVAIGGSAIYGVTLSWADLFESPLNAAAWLTGWTGAAWITFGLFCVFFLRKPPLLLAHVCLVTMTFGMLPLLLGSVINSLLPPMDPIGYVAINVNFVAWSNFLMAFMFSAQLAAVRVPLWKSLLAWFVVLNGSGALYASLSMELLQ